MRTEERSLGGPADFELGRSRSAPLTYTVAWPDGPAEGVVFLIPGFGGDADPAYAEALRRHVVEQYGRVAVSVRYHCIESRPSTGARISVDAREHFMLIGLAAAGQIPVENYADLYGLGQALGAAGQTGQIYARLQPGRGEYQNFGVLQALDHLAVLGDLSMRGPDFDRRNIVAMGSSHGGYIAHLIAKIAPGVLSAVIDNSSYVTPPMNYLGCGEGVEFYEQIGGALLGCRVESGWQFNDRGAPGFFGRDQDLVRDLGWFPHLKAARAAAGARSTTYLMANSIEDPISRPDAKQRQAAALRAAGFPVRLDLIGSDDLDGLLFKTLRHGMEASLKGLLDRYLSLCPDAGTTPEPTQAGSVEYDCTDVRYRFVRSERAPFVRGEIQPLYELDLEGT